MDNTYSAAPGARGATITDVNLDGIADVAIANALVFGDVAASNNITIMLVNGDGSFFSVYTINGYRNNASIASGNLD
ncbi:hypothetical protein [Paraferrimonas sp. SM1919]|uniref:hypothetical protein n=1 Tax=Paraferrimonas sp. SM1919 TaxID=2662263 RepID=UPI0013D43987|nr:hypothetical protein [Paraferrimonas sp. SM1919]